MKMRSGSEWFGYGRSFAHARACALLVIGVIATGCDRAQLLAPTSSTITVSAAARVLQLGANTEVTAFVLEQSGTPVHNGTTVRFTTTLGRVDPVEAQTTNGLAVTRFFAGESSGVAQVRATSGAATGTAGTGTNATTTNVVDITIGAAAASRVSLTATPSTVSSSGGTSQITATVADTSGNALSSVLVAFSTDVGSLSSSSATTDSAGRATVELTTNRAAKVTARVGGGTGTNAIAADVNVGVTSPASVTLAVAPASPAAGQPVTLTITPTLTAGNPAPRAVVIWGDGSQDDVGTVATARSVAHTYANGGSYTITVRVTTDGETTTASTGVTVGPAPSVAISASPTSGAAATTTFVFTVTPAAAANPKSVRIDFGDGSDPIDLGAITAATTVTKRYGSANQYTVRVTQENVNGTSSTAVVVVTAS